MINDITVNSRYNQVGYNESSGYNVLILVRM